MILLQAAIAAGFFMMLFAGLIFILSFALVWNKRSKKDKLRIHESSFQKLFFRFFTSITISVLIVIALLMLIIFIAEISGFYFM